MNPGYVYILVNPSMPGLIKIGRTLRDTRARARELCTTGVPMPFQVAFELFSEQHEELEEAAHAKLADFRVTTSREFFRYPLDKAIALLLELNRPTKNPESNFVAEDITEALQTKYPQHLRPGIVAVRIVQVPGRVWLEITEEREVSGYLKDQSIKRSDLAFIVEDEHPFFRPEDDVRANSRKFVEDYDPYSIIMTTDLFHDEACRKIASLHKPHKRSET
ncbi:GIY-YIG nuclease family protein [Sorangium sp. So ce394]|uniref:GIY-YIG nuclease family protein n=1 Tax=Sorangium sp. So ce394 TaxID=3133310 RepID=UPI003F5C0D7B